MSVNAAFFTNSQLASSKTRGDQIAERLECPVNKPFSKNECPKHLVFVKCFPNEIDELPKNTTIWYDPIDSDYGLERIAQRPWVNVLAISDSACKYLKARIPNKIITIKEHHCNFERMKRLPGPVKTVGFIGYKECFDLDFAALGENLERIGLSLLVHLVDQNTTRYDVCEFYKKIDMQITFRGPRLVTSMPPEMKNPLKVINAASFRIPTVGYPEVSCEEFPLAIPVHDFDETVAACERLRHQGSSFEWFQILYQNAEPYHIDHIIEQYKEILQ